jgi:hypothetical protein
VSLALNRAINPVYKTIEKAADAFSGRGHSRENLGEQLTGLERFDAGVGMGMYGVGTVMFSYAGAKFISPLIPRSPGLVAAQEAAGVNVNQSPATAPAPTANLAKENVLATGRNQAVFWSGVGKPGVPGYDVAMQWAAKNGGATLESTMAARGVKLPAWDSKNPAVVAAWEKASADFASGARGHVRVLQADTVGVKSIWGRIEYKALQSNSNVQSIRSVHPETGVEFLLWSR